MDKKQLAEFKTALLVEKDKLEKSLSKIARPVDTKIGDYQTTFEDLGSAKEDNATEMEQYTDNLSVEVALEKKLQDVIMALQKIEAGTYGLCENCHQPIDLDRLKINPSARTCTKCR